MSTIWTGTAASVLRDTGTGNAGNSGNVGDGVRNCTWETGAYWDLINIIFIYFII